MNLSMPVMHFRESLNVPLRSLSEVNQWKMYIENIANFRKISPMRRDDPLFEKAQIVQDLFNQPKSSQRRMNTFEIQALRKEMGGLLQEKASRLKVMSSYGLILSKIKPYQKEAFLTAISLKFQELTAKGFLEEKAFSSALAYGLSRSMIDPNEIVDCEELKSYTCPISGLVILSDAAYLKSRKPTGGKPYERYQEDKIRQWLKTDNKDPVAGVKVSNKEICKDSRAQGEVEAILCNYLYPEVKGITQCPSLRSLNPSENVFFAALLGYSIIKDLLEAHVLDVNEAHKWETLAIDLFTPFLEEMDSKYVSAFISGIQDSEEEMMCGFLTPRNNFSIASDMSAPWVEERFSSNVELFKTNPLEERIGFMREFLKNEIINGPDSLPLEEELRPKLQDKMQEYMTFFQEIQELDLAKNEKKDFQDQGIKVVLKAPMLEVAGVLTGKKRIRETSTSRDATQTLESLMESALEKSGGSFIKRAAYNSLREANQMELLTRVFS